MIEHAVLSLYFGWPIIKEWLVVDEDAYLWTDEFINGEVGPHG